MRFIVTKEGENLSALANRLFCIEGRERLTRARRRLLEINPHLPDRKNIVAGTIVFVPEDLDGEAPREGRSFGEVTEGVLGQLQELVGGLDATLDGQIRDESARQAEERKILGEPRLRRAAKETPELAERLKRLGEANAERQKRTEALDRFRRTASYEIGEDLAALAELTGGALPD